MRPIAACLLLAALIAQPAPLVFPPETGEVLVLPLGVTDGDTVAYAVLVRQTGRLWGINAPELHSKDPVEKAAGLASKANLLKLLPRTPVKGVLHGRDKWGRVLLDLHDETGVSLSQRQVEGGFAGPWDGTGKRP